MRLTASQLLALILVTLIWGINWTIMKVGVGDLPPLLFRAACLWLALPVLAGFMLWRRLPFHVPRTERLKLLYLGFINLVGWNMLIILAMPLLSSGRAAILGYTMPVFAAIAGAVLYKTSMQAWHFVGMSAALTGSVLLLWHEMAALAGRPTGVFLALSAALLWGTGTQMLRHARLSTHTVTFTFWTVLLGAVVLSLCALIFELPDFRWPGTPGLLAVIYNGLLALSVAQMGWFLLARELTPQASTLGVMLIPVIGVFSGVVLLGEPLHWQDIVAVVLMLLAMFSVLWPAKAP